VSLNQLLSGWAGLGRRLNSRCIENLATCKTGTIIVTVIHGMLKQLCNICLYNRMHSLVCLMQMIEKIHRQQVNATKEASAAAGIQKQGICPERPKVVPQESLFHCAAQISRNVLWESPG